MSQQPIQELVSTPITIEPAARSRALEFVELFRGFRLAINPAKVMIALGAILLIYTAGRMFDLAWGPQVYSGEIEAFSADKPDVYRSRRAERLDSRRSSLESILELAAAHDPTITAERINDLRNRPQLAYRALKRNYEQQFYADVDDARAERTKAEVEAAGARQNDPAFVEPLTPTEREQQAREVAAKRLYTRVKATKETVGTGIFDAFFTYELREFDALVDNTLTFVRVAPVRAAGGSGVDIEGSAVSGGLLSKNPERLWQSDTVVGCIANMTITGPTWLFSGTAPMQWRAGTEPGAVGPETWRGWSMMVLYRAWYLITLLVLVAFWLLVLALAGAVISRLSALEMAGVERAPLAEAFSFAVRRLWVFVKAPITPFLILLAMGVALAAAGLIGAIPFVGEILLGVMFVLFLAVGFVLMLLLLGILGGFSLLYPTIAVEGSDAFDAMSRAFAYVYARPWRLLFYSVISLIYGVITFLFVSFAVYLVLALTHTFVGWGTSLFGFEHGWYSGISKLNTLWPAPAFSRLMGPTNWYAMNWSEFTGSLFLHFWVYMLIASVGAYVISYYFSTHTIIYLLLRRSVDGQAMTEVMIDEAEVESEKGNATAAKAT